MSARSLLCSLLFLGLTLNAPRPAAAVSVVEPLAFGRWRVEPETGSFGVGAAIGLLSVDVVPTVEYVVTDDSNDWALSVDGHFPVLALPLVAFYVGAGATAYSHNPDQGDGVWTGGLNLLIGTKMSIRRLKPFAEVAYTTQGKDGVMLTLGTRFHLFD